LHVDGQHIRAWLHNGTAHLAPQSVSAAFEAFLAQIPWTAAGTRPGWDRIGGNAFSLSGSTASELLAWRESVLIGHDPYVAFWYSGREPSLICEAEFAFSNLDTAFWMAPGRRFLFGLTRTDNRWEPRFGHFAEYDGADLLVGSCPDLSRAATRPAGLRP
jgi:hypothetical protein